MQKKCNHDTDNESNKSLEIEIEGRSLISSFNYLTLTNSNRFEQIENRINSIEDLINKELTCSKTVLENRANGLYDNHLDRDVKFLREDTSSKNYIIKTLLDNISKISNSPIIKNSSITFL